MAVPVIGLVGGIGSGKSAVAAAFQRRGARVIAGDALAHEALRQPDIRARVVERWGPGVLDGDGSIARRKLAAIVFADDGQLRELEAIVQPWIRRRIEADVARAKADPTVPLVVLDAAVMLEAGWDGVCDQLIFVEAPEEVRLQRVARQRGWTVEELRQREQAQLPLTAKAARADHVLPNDAPLDELERRVDDLWRLWGPTTEEHRPRL